MSETISDIVAAHRSGTTTPEDTVRRAYQRIRAHGDPAVFITLRDEDEALAEARDLMAAGPEGKPLYGVPVAVKDNIDVAGLPTTAACPAYRLQGRCRRHRGDPRCGSRARSSSARPISTSSRPAWSACARLMACRAIRSATI